MKSHHNLAGKTCIVTGGAGLIGSWLSQRLVQENARVIIIDDLSKGRVQWLHAIEGQYKLRRGDLQDPAFTKDAVADGDYIFHLASRAYGVGYSSNHHLEMLWHNEAVSNNLLTAINPAVTKHLLVTSSSCVYRDDGPDLMDEQPLFDGEPEQVNRGYGWAKRLLEQKSLLVSENTGLPITIVRPFNIYGEHYAWQGQNSQAIPMLVKRVMDGENPVTVWGSGTQRRTYMHAADCAAIMLELVKKGHQDSPVNIGLDDTVTMMDLVQTICAAAGVKPDLVTDTSKPEGRRIKSSNPAHLRSILPDWQPAVSFEEGMARMISWYHAEFADRKGENRGS